MTDSESPKIPKLEIKDEAVQDLTDSETANVMGGMLPRSGKGGCGDTGSTLSTCTKITTTTGIPTTETC